MRRASDLSDVAAMLTATAFFVVADSVMKLATEALPPFEVLFLRSVAASLACAALVSLRREWATISGVFDRRALLRAAGETLCTLCYVVALALMPIADVVAILLTTPLIVVVGAALLLRERIGPARAGLVLAGFAGARMVAQPGGAGLSAAVLLAFAAAALGAVRDLAGRSVPSRIPVTVVNLATMIVLTVGAGAMSLGLESWTPPGGRHVAALGLAGVLVALGHVGLLLAYRLGRTASVAPFYYSFALWGVLSGLVVWGTLPDAIALAGIAIIVGSGVAVILLDRRSGRPEIAVTGAP